jgi:nitroreductase
MPTATSQTERREIQDALAEAAAVAGYAPSIHNTQPWHWKIRTGALELWAVPARRLPITDPDGRMATISCGAALHHARVALAARGYRAGVQVFPDPSHPEHLAHLLVLGRQPVTRENVRQSQAIGMRRTDRRPVTGTPVEDGAILAITLAVQLEGLYLQVLRPDQVFDLAAAASYAQRTEVADEAWRAELEYWAGGTRPAGSGVPDANIPAEPPQTMVPGRDFGRSGTLAMTAEHDTGARYAILYSQRDEPAAWLKAGQALSAGWLTATEVGVGVVPMSAAIEVPATRQQLHRMLVAGCYPQLVLRLGVADPQRGGPAATPRLPANQTVETIED